MEILLSETHSYIVNSENKVAKIRKDYLSGESEVLNFKSTKKTKIKKTKNPFTKEWDADEFEYWLVDVKILKADLKQILDEQME